MMQLCTEISKSHDANEKLLSQNEESPIESLPGEHKLIIVMGVQ